MRLTSKFTITYSIDKKTIYVNTDYNGYIIIKNEKGTAIYQDLDEGNALIKSYWRTEDARLSAINYLLKKEFI